MEVVFRQMLPSNTDWIYSVEILVKVQTEKLDSVKILLTQRELTRNDQMK